jgi:predicted nucleotidyltransferase
MRLDEKTREEIRQAARRFFGADVYLFGSRADDTRRGGDIDLYIETGLLPEQAVGARLAMLAHLSRRIGERRIDLVLNTRGRDDGIYQVARREGIKL